MIQINYHFSKLEIMKDVIIKKGRHWPLMSPFPLLNIDQETIAYNVEFTLSCTYDIGTADQADINKLFGIGYFPHHHKNSVRFGWRYDLQMDAIELLAYYYVNGERKWEHIAYVELYDKLLCVIDIMEEGHFLVVYNDNMKLGEVFLTEPVGRDIGYLLRPYFGGNQKAPHDICIRMEKLPYN